MKPTHLHSLLTRVVEDGTPLTLVCRIKGSERVVRSAFRRIEIDPPLLAVTNSVQERDGRIAAGVSADEREALETARRSSQRLNLKGLRVVEQGMA